MEIETDCETVEVASVLRAPHLRVCPECGAAFMPRYGSQVCCCAACAKVHAHRQAADSKTVTPSALKAEKAAKARRRAEFFAARDAAFEKAGQPVPRIEERGGVRIERRGTCVGGTAFNPTVPISTKSYYYR